MRRYSLGRMGEYFSLIYLDAVLRHILACADAFFRLCYSFTMRKVYKIPWLLVLAVATLAVADDADRRINNEAEISTTIEAEYAFATNACKAAIEIEYYQKGSSAHVESSLTNDDCDASSGTYVIQIRYRGADGKSQSKDFPETWERLDSNPVVVEKDYFVADDIDILRVRSRKLNCTCVPDEQVDAD